MMHKPEIENKFKQLSKLEMSVGAFSTLGITGIFIGMPLLALTAIGSSMLMTGYFNYKSMVDDSPLSILNAYTTKYYKKIFQKWFNNYIENSENLTEKKYKLIMTKLWLDQKYLNLHNLADQYKIVLDKVAEQLKENKETNLNIKDFISNTRTEIQAMDFINEDNNNIEKIAIAKKVYKEFENIGLLGKNMNNWILGTFPIAAYLQDYKINNEDINHIKKLINKKLKNHKMKRIDKIEFYTGSDDFFYDILDNLIDNNKPATLLVLKDFFSIVTDFHTFSPNTAIDKDRVINTIDKKAEYMALCEKVEEHVPTQLNKNPIRRNKI